MKTFPVLSRGFEIETEMTIHAVDKNMVIRNQVIEYRERPEGSESKVNTIPDGCKVLLTILNLYKNYRPFSVFGIISLSELIVAALFFFPVFLEFLETGLVRRFPTLIVCGFVVMGAFLTFTAGTILETLVQKDRQEFEFRLQLVEHFYKREKADN